MMRKGYTLIELLIVMVIIGILFTIGFLNYQDYSRQQSLLSVVRTIQSDIRTAQEAALSGDKPAVCINAANPNDSKYILNGYKFTVTSVTTYRIDADCVVNNVKTNVLFEPIINLPSGMTISNPNPNPIMFKAIGQGTNIPSGATASIVITQTSTGRTRTIVIGANGNVQ